jgi:hypothetical protein
MPTFIFLGALLLTVLVLSRPEKHADYRLVAGDPTARPFPLEQKSQFVDQLGEKKLTAADQYREGPDADLSLAIKQRIADDPRLSAEANRVTVISSEEAVTIRGEARTESEKAAIGKHADDATDKRVNNELKIR